MRLSSAWRKLEVKRPSFSIRVRVLLAVIKRLVYTASTSSLSSASSNGASVI